MSSLPSRFARGSHRAVASHPARAGFRPAAAAIAIAAAFGLQSAPLRAQPVGGQAIAGQASFAASGSNLVVTTQNAAGTNHSAINWQSFSVPAGSLTRFNQPSISSTSINRVLGPDPSSIFGTLSSNGRLVLVNPAGIAVGKGAVVDTAGFTASTLAMSEADAIAGRLRFAGNGGALQVDGTIVARSGDVVLIAPTVQTGADAVVQSANGATVLAAGQKVEITGRGLEGIRLEVQAPENQAVNLGTLQGDAVGIFAGTLKHSGLVQARAVTTEGGKVLLRAQGDTLVSGAIEASAANGMGGSIDVLGQRVGLLAGAALDASGAAGGGQVRVGGDYQGRNPDLMNAKRTYVDAQASIKADAMQQGDGGRVIVWSDEATRMHGQISARGGAQGGNGGFAEVSGKQYLEFTGRADLRAPRGRRGMLLLDPNDIEIVATPGANPSPQSGGTFSGGTGTTTIDDDVLNAQLASSDVLVTTAGGSSGPLGGRIHLLSGANVAWASGTAFSLAANTGIQIDGTIDGTAPSGPHGNVTLTSGGVIKVSDGATIRGGSITLTASDSGTGTGDILIGTTSLNASGGSMTLKADRDIGFATTAGTLTSARLYADVALTLEAGRNIAIGQMTGATFPYLNTTVDSNGKLTILAGQDITLSGPTTAPSPPYVGLSGRGGASGGVLMRAGGAIDFGDYSSVQAYQSPIDIEAGNSILGNGSFVANGTLNGTIKLTATDGGISFDSINSSGSFSGIAGGKVALMAKDSIAGNNLYAGGASGSGSGTGGAGGTITITSSNGDITLGKMSGSSIAVYGGAMVTGGHGYSLGSGGLGGAITLSAPGGNILVTSNLDADGGGSESATGGDARHAAPGIPIGSDQAISVSAGQTVNILGGVGASGGSSSLGAGGHGGAVTVQAGGQLTFGAAYARGGNATLGSASGGTGGSLLLTSAAGVSGGGADASGGWGPSGGDGGAVTIQGVDVSIPFVSARGGGQDDGAYYALAGSGNGGHGGWVVINFQNNLAAGGSFDASGANGRNGNIDSPDGGVGGNGGSVAVTRTAGDFSLYAQTLAAQGGQGGDAYFEFSGNRGGAGGNGGTVFTQAAGGSLSLSGGTFSAAAGLGGVNGDDSTRASDGALLGLIAARALNDLDISGANLYLGLTGFNAQAGGNIDLSSAITTRGGAVYLSAGDPSFPSRNPTAALSIQAPIDTTEGMNVPGGSVTLSGAQVNITTSNYVRGGSVTLKADSLALDGSVSATPSGTVSIDTYTAARTIQVGGTDAGDSLYLTQAELNQIEAGLLSVGSTANTGGLFVESPLTIDNEFVGGLRLLTGGSMHLDATVMNGASGDAVVLAADNIQVGTAGGLSTSNGRWLAYIAGALDNSNFGTLVSGNSALWNRTYAGYPPEAVTETGNRYLFAFQPTITINASSLLKEYDGTAITVDPQARTISSSIDAGAYGNVFLQDAAPTATVKVASSRNAGDYAIVLDAATVPDRYAVDFHEGIARITKRGLQLAAVAQSREYDATTTATANVNLANRVAGDDLSVTVGSANFADKDVGLGKNVSIAGLKLAGVDAGNYDLGGVTSAIAKADITPAPVTVTPDPQAKVQGTTLVFNGTEFSATGLKGGEAIASVTLSSPGAPAGAPIGVYAIAASAAVGANGFLAGNYNINYLDGNLVVGSPNEQQQVLNQVLMFSTLFIDQAKAQDALDRKKIDIGKDDIVVTDTQCKGS